MIQIQKDNQGQSLMEMLIAITILVIALVATIVLIVNSIEAGRESKNKLMATNFAREAIEIVRNTRDSNWIDPDETMTWDDGIDVGPVAVPVISYDTTSSHTRIVASSGFTDANAEIFYSETARMYFQASSSYPLDSESAHFYRVLYINPICHDSVGTEHIVDKESTDDCTSFPDEGDGPFGEVGLRVLAEVRWTTSSSNHNVVIEDRLYNWQAL